jgi:choline monooxygenase
LQAGCLRSRVMLRFSLMAAEFYIDPDIKKAQTMPSSFYTGENFFEASKEKIFARTWQLIAFTDYLSLAKNIHPVNILDGFLDEPVFISRSGGSGSGELNCLSNVCTHRGKILIDEPCEANLIRCGYHGRRFALDGKFLSMPEFEQAENFPAESDNLPKIPFETWAKFLFASVSPIEPLENFIGDMASRITRQDWDKLELRAEKTYTVNAHWALYCENYLEGFHIPFVHDALNRQLDYGSYSTELFRYSSAQTGHGQDGHIAAQYFFVFPNMMFNFYPWGLSLNIVKPVRPDLTNIEYFTFVSDESKVGQGAGAGLEKVEFEDQAVVESVQKGIRSRLYGRGRYSPTREQGCHHFHRLIAEFMTGSADGSSANVACDTGNLQ